MSTDLLPLVSRTLLPVTGHDQRGVQVGCKTCSHKGVELANCSEDNSMTEVLCRGIDESYVHSMYISRMLSP